MKILHVISSLDPAAGGPPAIAMRLAVGHALLGHEVSIFSYLEAGKIEAITESFKDIPNIELVRRYDIRLVGKVERLFATEARTNLRTLIPQFDWVYLHNVWDPIVSAAATVATKAGKPYFILLNGMLDPWSLSQSKWKKRIALALGYRKMLNNAAALHVGNNDEQELIRPLRLKPPTVILPNGVFKAELIRSARTPAFYDLSPGIPRQPFILFLGRLHTKKGLDVLADAFAIVATDDARVQLIVAGPDGNAVEDFDRRIAAAGIRDRVHRVGPLYGDAKLAALHAATVFCLPSRQEGFSVAVTEAMGIGLPVVITPGVHFPEVQSAGAGLVVPLDAKAVADALLQILKSPERRQEMSQNARTLIASEYTWQQIARRSVDAFERIVKKRTGAGLVSSLGNPGEG